MHTVGHDVMIGSKTFFAAIEVGDIVDRPEIAVLVSTVFC